MKSTRKSAGKMTKVVFRRYPDGQVIALFPGHTVERTAG